MFYLIARSYLALRAAPKSNSSSDPSLASLAFITFGSGGRFSVLSRFTRTVSGSMKKRTMQTDNSGHQRDSHLLCSSSRAQVSDEHTKGFDICILYDDLLCQFVIRLSGWNAHELRQAQLILHYFFPLLTHLWTCSCCTTLPSFHTDGKVPLGSHFT